MQNEGKPEQVKGAVGRELTPELLEAIEGIIHFSDALTYRNDKLSLSLRGWINRAADLTALSRPGSSNDKDTAHDR